MRKIVRLAIAPYVVAAFAASIASTAHAAGDVANGSHIAQAWCSGCHVTGVGGTDMAPPLAEIAARPGRDEDWFHTWLSDPHPPMPRLELSRRDIADLIAYLLSLQTQ